MEIMIVHLFLAAQFEIWGKSFDFSSHSHFPTETLGRQPVLLFSLRNCLLGQKSGLRGPTSCFLLGHRLLSLPQCPLAWECSCPCAGGRSSTPGRSSEPHPCASVLSLSQWERHSRLTDLVADRLCFQINFSEWVRSESLIGHLILSSSEVRILPVGCASTPTTPRFWAIIVSLTVLPSLSSLTLAPLLVSKPSLILSQWPFLQENHFPKHNSSTSLSDSLLLSCLSHWAQVWSLTRRTRSNSSLWERACYSSPRPAGSPASTSVSS